ncbi:MAG: hypothetical protein WDW38_003209 [Sanguina aurantia]
MCSIPGRRSHRKDPAQLPSGPAARAARVPPNRASDTGTPPSVITAHTSSSSSSSGSSSSRRATRRQDRDASGRTQSRQGEEVGAPDQRQSASQQLQGASQDVSGVAACGPRSRQGQEGGSGGSASSQQRSGGDNGASEGGTQPRMPGMAPSRRDQQQREARPVTPSPQLAAAAALHNTGQPSSGGRRAERARLQAASPSAAGPSYLLTSPSGRTGMDGSGAGRATPARGPAAGGGRAAGGGASQAVVREIDEDEDNMVDLTQGCESD